jgi:hypothetical protein
MITSTGEVTSKDISVAENGIQDILISLQQKEKDLHAAIKEMIERYSKKDSHHLQHQQQQEQHHQEQPRKPELDQPLEDEPLKGQPSDSLAGGGGGRIVFTSADAPIPKKLRAIKSSSFSELDSPTRRFDTKKALGLIPGTGPSQFAGHGSEKYTTSAFNQTNATAVRPKSIDLESIIGVGAYQKYSSSAAIFGQKDELAAILAKEAEQSGNLPAADLQASKDKKAFSSTTTALFGLLGGKKSSSRASNTIHHDSKGTGKALLTREMVTIYNQSSITTILSNRLKKEAKVDKKLILGWQVRSQSLSRTHTYP